MKRIVTIQDISCLGKCSLTVALPIISAMGVEAAVVPTAVLSTHTAFHQGYTFHDLTDEIAPISAHWEREQIQFDGIYTGYLGSIKQIALVSDFFDTFGENATIIIDPVMADYGKLYAGFTPEYVKEMAKLCRKADLIVPNITEACLMLDIPYQPKFDEAGYQDIVKKLAEMGPRYAAITGVILQDGRVGVMSYDKEAGTYFFYDRECLPVNFHGTGDIFASTVTGAIARGKTVNEALSLAVDMTVESISLTMKDPSHNLYGVNFEEAIPYLIEKM